MNSHGGASGVKGSSRVGRHGTEDVSEESSNNKTFTQCSKAVRQRQRSAGLPGEGKSSSVEPLVRPALLGQKAHKKTCSKDNDGRWREGNQDREDDRLNAEYVEGRERGKLRQRRTERTVAQDREGRGSSESLSSSNSDIQPHSNLEAGDGLNLQRGLSNACTLTNSTGLNPQSPGPALSSCCSAPPQPPIQLRSTPLSPQRLSSRTAGELHCYSFCSSREPDPFWVERRRGEGNLRSSQSHLSQTHIPPLTSSELGEEEEEEEVEEEEEDGDEGGSGVMELMGQPMTSAAVPSYVPLGERKISKRERNRIKCLRRRQRRRDRWRQSQLQESRQVNDANSLI